MLFLAAIQMIVYITSTVCQGILNVDVDVPIYRMDLTWLNLKLTILVST